MDEVQHKTLYVRFPHQIRNMDQVRDLFVGDFQIKLPRQSTRHCHVIFPNVEEKVKNLKAVKGKLIDNKKIIVSAPKIKPKRSKTKEIEKQKTRLPTPNLSHQKITTSLFVSNIPQKTTRLKLKTAFESCKSASFIDPKEYFTRRAIVKLENPVLAQEYLKKIRQVKIGGNELIVTADQRKQKKKKESDSELRIFDGEEDVTEKMSIKTNVKKNEDAKEDTDKEDIISNKASEDDNKSDSENEAYEDLSDN